MITNNILKITARMSRQPRSNSGYNPTQPRNSKSSNINIQINFNMKDKQAGFTGKKIDNYVEVEQKQPKNGQEKGNQEQKNGKKRTIEHGEREKTVNTPHKNRVSQRYKNSKNTIERTPERRSIERKEERSKSTNQKGLKRKSGKSLANLKTGVVSRKKEVSPRSDLDRSRSHSKSSKKFLKSNDSSLKNLFAFTNSGIKKRIKGNKESREGRDSSRERQKSGIDRPKQQHDHEKIKKFMEDKKKREKKEKVKQLKQEKAKKEKMREELKKVEADRKAYAGAKLVHSHKNTFEEKQLRLPMYFDDDESFDESGDYERLNQEASSIVRDSPTPKKPIQTISISKNKQKEHHSSSKKSLKKHKKVSLVHNYLTNTITASQMQELVGKVTKIQAFWRGSKERQRFWHALSEESTRIRYAKRRIDNKQGAYWREEEKDNSVIHVENDGPNYDSELSLPQHAVSNQGSNLSWGSQGSAPRDRFKKLSLQLEDGEGSPPKSDKEKEPSDNSSLMQREIEELKRQLEAQNEKYRSLQQENQHLRENMSSKKEERAPVYVMDRVEDMANSKDWNALRMPKKIGSPSSTEPISRKVTRELNIKIEDEGGEQKQKAVLDSFKKQFQAYECSSPSNAVLEEQLKSLKKKNVAGMFRRKEIKLEEKYQKKAQMFEKMLNDSLFSPRTYSVKKKELEGRMDQERQELRQRQEEAKRVVGFIGELSSEDEEKEAEAPKQEVKEESHQGLNFKKEKAESITLVNTCTNTDPQEAKPQLPAVEPKQKQDNFLMLQDNSNSSSYTSEDDKIYKKYWTDDIEQVHKHTLAITRKIDEALKADTDESNSRQSLSQGYRSEGATDVPEIKPDVTFAKEHLRNKSDDVECHQPDDILPEAEPAGEAERKAREIFNRIDFGDDVDCRSEEESLQNNSHDQICRLLNERPRSSTSPRADSSGDNLYLTEAEFNKRKRKEEEQLSRSSSFEKSNKSSLSANNNSSSMTAALPPKGFMTNLTFIKEFCISVCEFIRNNNSHKAHFVGNITLPIRYDPEKYLASYRETLTGETNNQYNSFAEEYAYPYFKNIAVKQQPITSSLFQEFIKSFDEDKSLSPRFDEPKLSTSMKEIREYFLISIIDAFNESLEFQKPGSVHGEPFPWLANDRVLKNHKIQTLAVAAPISYDSIGSDPDEPTQEERHLDQIFGSSIAKVIQWGSSLCGFIPDPMPMELGDSQIASLSEQQLNSIRQNRVGLMLEKWLMEEEEAITDSNAEWTEVLLALGEKIVEQVMAECGEEVAELVGQQAQN